ncbi:HTH-type transcriptional repressor CytR [Pelagimonas phthalicica]|uniref:HTH-type transcriptional repressor CytR n=1 Tax=Pelagimonas phthalicica TaxID=1037362 RepID=A0A238J6Y5_9RHOB|nr:LacI family DNA-binding transcriptional regulator [Pelagimonas phthalicica]TDS95046.1 LacI family transcriptional regulator [Pelagimonas phthalicica]SMX26428.1 HTH-type transcriptional repressor CytR [Pelagimonas phthalicica]
MAKTPRIQDIALLAEVAPSTVSHVLNGTAPISPEVSQRILSAARELGYLAKRRRKAAVALLPTVLLSASEANFPKSDRNYVSWTMLNAFRQECRARSIRLIPHIDKGDKIIPESLVAAIEKHRPQGVAIMQDDGTDLIDAVHGLDPSIVILSGQDPSMRVDTVSPGNRFAAQMATDYLFQLGHRRVAHVTYGTRLIGQHRKYGFLDAYRASGYHMPPGAIIDVETFRPEIVTQKMLNWLAVQRRPLPFTAFFCSADNVAIGVMDALAKSGVKVPGDVSVLGFDNVEIGKRQNPPLSTVHVPMEEIGQVALNLLEEARTLPKNERSARRVELGCKIIVRGSTTGPHLG